jgi:uncharacterized protein (TIGR02246 family)
MAFWIASASPGLAQDDVGEVQALMQEWATAYGAATSASEMLGYYDADAVFWGTGARQPFVGGAEIEPYFAQQFANFAQRKVSFIDPIIRIYGDTATATGLYKFEVETAGGEAMTVAHRYSFAFVKQNQGWIIIHQHSSQLP